MNTQAAMEELFRAETQEEVSKLTIKPPLGLMPRREWEYRRIVDIVCAMHRYVSDGKDLPPAWITELYELRRSTRMLREKSDEEQS